MKWNHIILIFIAAQIFLANCVRKHLNHRIDTEESTKKEIEAQKKKIKDRNFACTIRNYTEEKRKIELKDDYDKLERLEKKLKDLLEKIEEDKVSKRREENRENERKRGNLESNAALLEVSKANRDFNEDKKSNRPYFGVKSKKTN